MEGTEKQRKERKRGTEKEGEREKRELAKKSGRAETTAKRVKYLQKTRWKLLSIFHIREKNRKVFFPFVRN